MKTSLDIEIVYRNFVIAHFIDNIFLYTVISRQSSDLRDKCKNLTRTLFGIAGYFLENESKYRNCLYELFDIKFHGLHFCSYTKISPDIRFAR